MPRKVAIVIGVRRADGFPELPGATNGARAFADWAAAAGFDVSRYLDEGGQRVEVGPIVAEIDALVEARDVEQLFLYFAGHGLSGRIDDDYWVLSRGVRQPREAVDVGESLRLARHARIPHVVVFADACRTLATERSLGVLHGASPLFPYLGVAPQVADVDVFYAARTASPAYEVLDDDAVIAAHGVFTRVLMAALEGKDERAARRDPSSGEKVIHAQSLAQYLREQVEYESSALPVPVPQVADCRPVSALPRRITTLGQPGLAQLTVEARLPNREPADGAMLAILRFDAEAIAPWREVHRGAGPRLSATLPLLQPYGVAARLDGYSQTPASPNPIQFLQADTTCAVTLVPLAQPAISFEPSELEPAATPPPGPSLTRTFLVDEAGRRSAVAPHHGVFFVSTEDAITGRTASEMQEVAPGQAPRPVAGLAADEAAERWVATVASHEGRGHFETRTGLTFVGAGLAEAAMAAGPAGVFEEGGAWHVRPPQEMISGSAVARLADGRVAALAMFAGFIGTATIGRTGVDHVSYTPAPGSPYDVGMPPEMLAEARRLVALAGAAAHAGRFEVAVDEALGLAARLRMFKHQDPVMGIFAAYAYHLAGNVEQIRDMIGYFLSADQPVPFDVALLGGAVGDLGDRVAPAYPMLRQGWAFLGPDDRIHPALAAFRRSLTPSLWATGLGPEAPALAVAVAEGELP